MHRLCEVKNDAVVYRAMRFQALRRPNRTFADRRTVLLTSQSLAQHGNAFAYSTSLPTVGLPEFSLNASSTVVRRVDASGTQQTPGTTTCATQAGAIETPSPAPIKLAKEVHCAASLCTLG